MEHLIWSELLVKSGLAFKHNASGATGRKMFMGKNYIELDKEKLLPAFAAALQNTLT